MKTMRILVSRTDRLGDVLLALPTLDYLRRALPEAPIDFLVQDLYAPVLAPLLQQLSITPVLEINGSYTHFLSLYSDRKTVWQAIQKRAGMRVGIYSKPWSFFLYSDGVRQRRSEALKSEAEYNLDLAKHFVARILGKAPEYRKPALEIPIDPNAELEAKEHLLQIGIKVGEPFSLFHPGMRGSAINLSPKQYLDLIDRAENKWGDPVVLSIGPVLRDQEISKTILSAKPYLKVVRNVEIPVLKEIFRLAKVVLAPSTGPLHLAHYVGTRTIGLYPPVKTQNTTRWAPWGGSGVSSVFFPRVKCPAEKACLGSTCVEYLCMEKMDWVGQVI